MDRHKPTSSFRHKQSAKKIALRFSPELHELAVQLQKEQGAKNLSDYIRGLLIADAFEQGKAEEIAGARTAVPGWIVGNRVHVSGRPVSETISDRPSQSPAFKNLARIAEAISKLFGVLHLWTAEGAKLDEAARPHLRDVGELLAAAADQNQELLSLRQEDQTDWVVSSQLARLSEGPTGAADAISALFASADLWTMEEEWAELADRAHSHLRAVAEILWGAAGRNPQLSRDEQTDELVRCQLTRLGSHA